MYSLNEIESAAKRAARGAGLPWGIAEEAGKATRWLEANGWPGAENLLGLLQDIDGTDCRANAPDVGTKIWSAPSGTLCPLMTGTALSDRADWLASTEVELEHMLFPLLLLPFLASVAVRTDQAFRVSWEGATAIVGPSSCAMTPKDVPLIRGAKVTCQPTTDTHFVTTQHRADIAADIWQGLDAFGHRTFAPDTEASRLSGAGAGVSDYD